MLSGATYNTLHCFNNWRKTDGKFWMNQNIIVGGKFRCINAVGFLAFCLMYFIIQNMAFMTMWFADLAQINVGVITVIWSINPLYMAAVDYFLFKIKLKYFHFIGTIMIVGCTVLLALKPFIIPNEDKGEQKLNLVKIPTEAP